MAAIHRIGPVATEFLYVKLMGAQANLLVGIEAHTDLAVLDFRVFLQIGHGRDYLCDACLVVGAEKRGAVGNDQVLAKIVEKFGEILRRKLHILLGIEDNLLAVVILYDARIHMAARHVGARVHMRYESDHRHIGILAIGGKCAEKIAIVVEGDVLKTHP